MLKGVFQHLGTVTLVGLVLLAGCVGGLGGTGDSEATTTPAPTGTTVETTTDPSTSDPSTDGSTPEPTTTTAPDGGEAEDPAAVLATHRESVSEAGTYTVVYEMDVSSEQESTSIAATAYVDETTGAQFKEGEVQEGDLTATIEQFSPPGEDVIYQWATTAQGEEHFGVAEPYRWENMERLASPIGPDSRTGVEEVPAFRYEGLVDTPDGERHRYVVDDLNQLTERNEQSLFNGVRPIHLEMVMLVDPDSGLITEFTFDYGYDYSDGDQPTEVLEASFSYRYVDVGTTSVNDEPDWLDEARASS